MSGQQAPSMDQWLREAKARPESGLCGMYLFHTGTVRETPKSLVREGRPGDGPVTGMRFDYDDESVAAAIAEARAMPGIYHVRVWLNRGDLLPGDDIMRVLVGGDIRPRVVDALQTLVERLKTRCVSEQEIYAVR